MATDWSDAAKAKRSAAAKKAAETRKANQARQKELADGDIAKETRRALAYAGRHFAEYPYIQNSRVARWALSGVSILAMMRGTRHFRWGRPTPLMRLPFSPEILRG